MITIKQAWVGFLILFLVMLLVVVAAMYWHHVTGTHSLHFLAMILPPIPLPPIPQGC
jgi:hypothetical protein